MEFKQIKVAELDKEDIRIMKELEAERRKVTEMGEANLVKIRIYWEMLAIKHRLGLPPHHFIRGRWIYKKELS